MQSNLLYQAEQIRTLENLAIEKTGITVDELMLRAGTAAFRELKNFWPKAKKITVVCGKGNNGGDGYVVARLAKLAKCKVTILQLATIDQLKGAAKNAALECEKLKIKMESFAPEKLQDSEIIVDAIFGTGLTGEIDPKNGAAIAAINKTKIPVLSLDIPSGIDADTGNNLGEAIRTAVTVTFLGNKIGLFVGEGLNVAGEIICDNLGIPEEILSQITPAAQLLDLVELKKLLPPRSRTAHKGNFGHVLVIGSDYGMPGAARMAAQAAMRAGAGLVTIATRPEHSYNSCPEVMCVGISFMRQLRPLIEKADVIVLGPGLGQSHWSKKVWQVVMKAAKPMVIDADALNILATNRRRRNDWVLTPHPGEAARLLFTDAKAIQVNRFTSLLSLQRSYGGVVVLKGAGTLIGNSNETVGLCNYGNPGMATGGMGDILSGIIAGLVAQGLSLRDAANLGVVVHAKAGDMAAGEEGEIGMMALDLLPYVRKILN